VNRFAGRCVTPLVEDRALRSSPAGVRRDARLQAAGARALGYVSVCAGVNGTAQAALTRQAEAIRCACEARGLELVAVMRDLETPPRADSERLGLRHVLEQISAGEASCLVVEGLDRLGASAAAVGTLAGWFDADGRRLVAADLGLDTETRTGKVALRALAAAGQPDTRKLAERTRRGLAAARANGGPAGRPSVADRPGLCEGIAQMRADGRTLQAIADELNAQGVPTLRGGAHWRPSSVQPATGYKRPGRVRRLEDPRVPGLLPATPAERVRNPSAA
jgi:DNA invertase Pin-like site-specific DNA recombinase